MVKHRFSLHRLKRRRLRSGLLCRLNGRRHSQTRSLTRHRYRLLFLSVKVPGKYPQQYENGEYCHDDDFVHDASR
jgi:hypothetical protein